ncbi:glycoside hydrolase family 15 protein [Enterovirga aerilata]|uniref:Trehalase n=1 Tax=Enterovirga aerilata TaxID=2730920 RepID=A0A849I4H7_9HYPH|nr:glycoside hydrolase family 15 protein [Enterovirga sp. DB1703]NNM72258.1 glycoside hydrolase family 15 protein [Enterovirga sp. DB1703]
MQKQRIEDYALIGDCETAALVDRAGSIDWLCWPRFDSDACFAAILGTREHGHWQIAPERAGWSASRRYRGNTLILETRFETGDGVVTLIDFMPPRGNYSDVVRIVRGEAGAVRLRMDLTIRFGYGHTIPWVTRLEDGTLRAIAGPDMVVLRTPAETHGEGMSTVSEFTVAAGESIPFVLTYGPSHHPCPNPIDPFLALEETESFWSDWAGHYDPDALNGGMRLAPHWRDAVVRSLVTLKALTYAPTGGIVAAATTSLPEWPGGPRNWDYRYCWLRDSAMTLYAFMSSGYFEEAEAWRDWLVRAMAGSVDQMQIMFGLAGERRLLEWKVEWLPGFEGSRPVRIGNAAAGQLQLDVFGEVMALLHGARHGGLRESKEAWALQRSMLDSLESLWREPDEGIWEVRGPSRHFTFSKVMAWVAFDRCIRSAEEFGLDDAPLDRWREIRDEIHRDVCSRGYDPAQAAFVQSYGSPHLDASLLLLPILGFLPDDDPRIRGTIEAIERELLVDGFVLRYRPAESVDGLPGDEGAFLACSFWLVVAYLQVGRLDDACALFERLLAISNDVGLLAEEYDPRSGRQLGNFPQAFSHVGLVTAAHRLGQALASQRAEPPQPAATAVHARSP